MKGLIVDTSSAAVDYRRGRPSLFPRVVIMLKCRRRRRSRAPSVARPPRLDSGSLIHKKKFWNHIFLSIRLEERQNLNAEV